MRILVTTTDSLGGLVTYLRRCGCDVEIVGSNAVDVSPPPGASVTSAHLRIELDGYLWVWRAMNPGVGAELVGQSPSEPAAAQT